MLMAPNEKKTPTFFLMFSSIDFLLERSLLHQTTRHFASLFTLIQQVYDFLQVVDDKIDEQFLFLTC